MHVIDLHFNRELTLVDLASIIRFSSAYLGHEANLSGLFCGTHKGKA